MPAFSPRRDAGIELADGAEVFADQASHLEHRDLILPHDGLQLLVAKDVALVGRVLELVSFDIVPRRFVTSVLGSGSWPTTAASSVLGLRALMKAVVLDAVVLDMQSSRSKGRQSIRVRRIRGWVRSAHALGLGLATPLSFQPVGDVADGNDAARHDDGGCRHDARTQDERDAALDFAMRDRCGL